MRFTIATRAGGWRWSLACALLVSALSIGAVGTVSGSNGEPTAAASKKKKKCKKALWKCAPENYHLSVSGHYGPQVYSAEVDLEKNRSNFARVEYSQKGGSLTVSTTYQGSVHFQIIDQCAEGRFVVADQTSPVPRRGLFGDFDFALFFWAKGKQWKYSVMGGNTYGSNITFPGTVTCLSGSSAGDFGPVHALLPRPARSGQPTLRKAWD